MYKITTNASGTRSISLSDDELATIDKYSLLDSIVSSEGIVDEATLYKLRCNVKSYIMRHDDCPDLVSLAQNVIFHDNMKAYGLRELIILFVEWKDKQANN